uniref:(California timema) hypothetical protein n=1 Tax=Timema californicum TaxID=61474 RepID=A0A7R9P3E5_TIMCA|nr:unnamed protein product [Timema californicum]
MPHTSTHCITQYLKWTGPTWDRSHEPRAVLLLGHSLVLPGLRLDEFQKRRSCLMESIYKLSSKDERIFNNNHLVVIPSSSKLYMSEKIPYVFRQNTDFLYLSGCLEPGSALVLSGTGGGHHTSTLFVRQKDVHSEMWDGPRTGTEGALELFGVEQSLPMQDLGLFLKSFSKSHSKFMLWYDFTHPAEPEVHKTMQGFLANTINKVWESPKHLLHRLRLYKSPSEVALMHASCKVASEAIAVTMQDSHPGVTEHQLFARVDYECRMRGAETLAYPPVVAGGTRANIIHYISNNQVVQAGEMVLMDAGCEYHGYNSDITRTWPISGKFSSNQLELYEAVLSVQSDLIKRCSNFPSLDSLFYEMCDLLGHSLQQVGLLPRNLNKDQLSKAAYSYCPHHVSHYLGMDVHDTALIPRSIPLEPGMIITIEPGVYVSPKNQWAPPEFYGMGIRVEDDILITSEGPVVLTESCPKTVEQVEKLASFIPSVPTVSITHCM